MRCAFGAREEEAEVKPEAWEEEEAIKLPRRRKMAEGFAFDSL